jgi:single-stranded-DNA-specific exonuclease
MTTQGSPVMRNIVRRKLPDQLLAKMPETVHPVLQRVYAARGVTAQQVDLSLSRLIPVSELKSAAAVAERLADAYVAQERILILGDFDADGATGTALSVSCLRAMGFQNVTFLVPNRIEFGYGLSPAIADQAAKLSPDLIMTVDNGISSSAGVRRARQHGIEVLVTDHHLPGSEVPEALCIANPNLPDEPFPSKCLAGVGVAFYVMAALGRRLVDRGVLTERQSQSIVASGLDLVALGTVADLVMLDYNNRVMVAEGLARIRAGRTRPGLRALFAAAGRILNHARSADLAFAIAPRLNAAGRLTDMSLGIDCLLATDDQQALHMARHLDGLNIERRELQAQMETAATEYVLRAKNILGDNQADAYCLFDQSWHEGVVGLVASRVKDQTRRPVIALAKAGSPGRLKGSARSVEGIHIRDVIDAVATRHPGIIQNFGGHAAAAGLTLNASDLDVFRDAFTEEVGRFSAIFEQPDVILTDGALSAADMRLDLAEVLNCGGPWGQGFPEPMFENELEIVGHRLLKDRHLKLQVRHPGDEQITDAIAFNQAIIPMAVNGASIRFVYRLDVNEFRGRRTHQLVVEHMQSE